MKCVSFNSYYYNFKQFDVFCYSRIIMKIYKEQQGKYEQRMTKKESCTLPAFQRLPKIYKNLR